MTCLLPFLCGGWKFEYPARRLEESDSSHFLFIFSDISGIEFNNAGQPFRYENWYLMNQIRKMKPELLSLLRSNQGKLHASYYTVLTETLLIQGEEKMKLTRLELETSLYYHLLFMMVIVL